MHDTQRGFIHSERQFAFHACSMACLVGARLRPPRSRFYAVAEVYYSYRFFCTMLEVRFGGLCIDLCKNLYTLLYY